jgi:hypothetical protein
MKYMSWIKTIMGKLWNNHGNADNFTIPSDKTTMLLKMINRTQVIELSCDEVHKLLDQYAELVIRGEDVASLLPLVHKHLDLCPDCSEEYEALLQIMAFQGDKPV